MSALVGGRPIVATSPVELGTGVREDALREDDAFFRAVARVREALHGTPVPAAGRESR